MRLRRAVFALASLAFFASSLAAACTSASPAPTTCDACWMAQCTSQLAACNANADCKAIEDCVTQSSPCTHWTSVTYCDDDCVKVTCANDHPAGIALYKALGTCDNSAECSTGCAELCTANANIQKCEVNDLCDLQNPNPDDCKCNQLDGGGASDASDDGASDDGSASCPVVPTCPDESVVSAALGLDLVAPHITNNVSGGFTVIICLYKGASGTTDIATLRYEYPDTLADFMDSRIGFMSTMDVDDLGSPPVPAYSSPDDGLSTLVAHIGCIDVELSSTADLAVEEAYVASMIPTLDP